MPSDIQNFYRLGTYKKQTFVEKKSKWAHMNARNMFEKKRNTRIRYNNRASSCARCLTFHANGLKIDCSTIFAVALHLSLEIRFSRSQKNSQRVARNAKSDCAIFSNLRFKPQIKFFWQVCHAVLWMNQRHSSSWMSRSQVTSILRINIFNLFKGHKNKVNIIATSSSSHSM